MSEDFSPRTIALVALASLMGGFVAVFGGGMLLLRARTELPTESPGGRSVSLHVSPGPVPDGAASGAQSVPRALDASHPASPSDAPELVAPSVFDPAPAHDPSPSALDVVTLPSVQAGDGGALAVQAAGVTITPATVSRCFLQASTAPIAASACDALPALDQHMISRAAEISGCTQGHGRLSLIMDFRFSTSFARAWGGPSSTVPDAGTVAACVRRVTAPLPLSAMQHAHDRYIVVYGITW